MKAQRQTDNANLASKLLLRRTLLKGRKKLNVLDCCQGHQAIWKRLRAEHECTYMGVDVKPGKGRLQVDSVRLLDIKNLEFNVVDVDTYGSPWKHLLAVLKNGKGKVCVFLTVGSVKIGGGNYDRRILEYLQCPRWLPNSLGTKLQEEKLHELIYNMVHQNGWKLRRMLESTPGKNARYIGIEMERNRS